MRSREVDAYTDKIGRQTQTGTPSRDIAPVRGEDG